MSRDNQGRRVALYLRVSTDNRGQTVENQRRELMAAAERHGWQIVTEFKDEGISGAKGRDARPAYDKLLKGVTRKDFDMVAAWSVDRLGRSLQHLVAFLEEIRAAGVDLYLHQQGLDTSTPAGRAMFGMLSVFGEFERAITVERIHAGISRRRAAGLPMGRPTIDARTEDAIRAALERGDKGMLKIAAELGVGSGTVQRVRREMTGAA